MSTEFKFTMRTNIPRTPKCKWELTPGEHKVRCIDYDFEDAHEETDYYGNVRMVKDRHVVVLKDIQSGDEVKTYVYDTDKAIDFFGNAVDRLSKGDLKSKINGANPGDLEVSSVCAYIAKYPISIWYDQESYIDPTTNEMRMSRPKVLWYNPNAGKVEERKPSKKHIHFDF